jgi:hypothetical protein
MAVPGVFDSGSVTPTFNTNTQQISPDYHWADNGTGGVNYFAGNSPISREIYQSVRPNENVSAIEQWVAQQHQQPGDIGTAAATGPGYGTSGLTPQDSLNLLGANYDTQRSQFQNQLNVLPQAQQNADLRVSNSFQNSQNGLDSSLAMGQRNLKVAGDQLNQSKAMNLQQLKDQVGSMYDSYMRQPGVSDSSAGGLISNALGRSASNSRANLLMNTGQQQQRLDLQGSDMQTQYNTQTQALQQQKADALNQIGMQFMQQRHQIEQQMAGADANKAQALAQQNSANLQQAMQALQNLQALYGRQSQELEQQYSQYNAPSYDLGNLAQYQVQPYSVGQLQGFRGVPAVNSSAPDMVAPMFKKQDNLGF